MSHQQEDFLDWIGKENKYRYKFVVRAIEDGRTVFEMETAEDIQSDEIAVGNVRIPAGQSAEITSPYDDIHIAMMYSDGAVTARPLTIYRLECDGLAMRTGLGSSVGDIIEIENAGASAVEVDYFFANKVTPDNV